MRLGDRITAIVTILLQEFTHGIRVEPQTLTFAESTYGITCATFASALADDDFEERDTLLNLLFFPNQNTRRAIELFLPESGLQDAEVATVSEQLYSAIDQVVFSLPDGSVFSWVPEPGRIAYFVAKLYMDRKLDASITAALKKHVDGERLTAVRVTMRCRHIGFTSEGQALLITFIEKGAERTKDFESLIDLLFTLVSNLPPRIRLIEYLFDQHHYQKKLLHDIRTFQKKADQYGMEYLMMQGYPVPHESEENVSDRLKQYDILINQVLVLQDPRETYLNRRDLGTFDSNDDLQQLFRNLS